MNNSSYPIAELGILKPLMQKYASQDPTLNPFINHFPSLSSFAKQIEEKNNHKVNRSLLVDEIHSQYKGAQLSEKTRNNINSLLESSTYTVTTGHQPCLFTGPLYFIIKILQTIKLADTLSSEFSEHKIIPVYWMGAEDHDFEEVNHFNLYRKVLKWESEQKGAVGRFSTEGLDKVIAELSEILGDGRNNDELRMLFKNAYIENSNYGDATRYLVNELFGDRGLVIVDGDSQTLKEEFKLSVIKELKSRISHSEVSKCCDDLSKHGKVQVKPREINLFYLDEKGRDRIIAEKDHFVIDNRKGKYSLNDLLTELEKQPDKFSPNVLLRPVYQELLLPNLAYIGGPGEIAYWLELGLLFKSLNIPIPLIVLRNSFVFIGEKQANKLNLLGLEVKDLFGEEAEWSNKLLRTNEEELISFTDEKSKIMAVIDDMKDKAVSIDSSMNQVFEGEKIRMEKTLDNLENKVYKAQKRKNASQIEQVIKIKERVFPNGVLQERKENFAAFYAIEGKDFFSRIYESIDPINPMMNILVI